MKPSELEYLQKEIYQKIHDEMVRLAEEHGDTSYAKRKSEIEVAQASSDAYMQIAKLLKSEIRQKFDGLYESFDRNGRPCTISIPKD